MYRVTKKFVRGPESPIGTYKTIDEAKKVIQEKLQEDATLKINTTYLLYEAFDELIEQFDQSKLVASTGSQSQDSGSSQRGSSQSFSPSPFSTTPQPKGMPRSWVKDEDKKDDKK